MEFTNHQLNRLLICLLGFTFTQLLFSSCAKLGPDSDRQALLSFKNHVTRDPFGELNGWNVSSPFCLWNGVFCSTRHGRVVSLDLHAKNLTGTISPYIGNMSFLKQINLRSNFFHGHIPNEIGRLHRLQSLGLTLNLLQGLIPTSLSNCSELIILDLVSNNLEGTIPEEIGKLSKLIGLGLAVNRLTGPIPKPISNLTSLAQLSLSENTLSGDIPQELNNLRNLNMFQISANQFLTGSIPRQLFNLSSMDYFGVSQNQLVGEIPTDIGSTLPNVRILMLGGNRFTGSIPVSIINATKIERLLLDQNGLTGPVPNGLGNLKKLQRLNLGMNGLGKGRGNNDLDFLHSLVNCSSLEVLAFNNNTLSGVLPGSISNLSSNLNFLLMGANNNISGKIPADINKLENLLILGMEENSFEGTIPSSIGYLRNLQVLSIFGNRFSGEIPDSLGNLSSLIELGLDRNLLEGRIPSSLGGCSSLQRLGLRGNNLSGTIAKEVIGLASLSDWLDLSENRLAGPIPDEIRSLRNLRLLDLSENELSGEIPSSIENCNSLEVLFLSGNSLRGSIPSSLKNIKGIQELDLSRNNFTGVIPDFLSSLPFTKFLNLSFNDLDGPIPDHGIFKNLTAFSVVGNYRLCGGIEELHLKHCRSRQSKLWRHIYFRVIIIVSCILACLVSTLLLIILVKRNPRGKKSADPEASLEDKFLKITYSELAAATNGFSPTNLVGSGSYGSVYKGCLVRDEELNVAIKVIDLHQKGAVKSFVAECEVLRGIRHRNLVKIITSCSSTDRVRNEFKALVFEYMPNGSLENWLHNNRDGEVRKLSFAQRLSIAVDVGHALDYLHRHVDEPVVHCDVKPSNVLLDEEMVARVGDFGLAKLLYDKNTEIHSSLSTNAFKGTIGYVAPEYGLAGEVSTKGDVYGFGILLLELFTGKRPTNEMFMEDLSLHSFVERAIPNGITEVTEPNLLEESVQNRGKMEESLVKVFKIGILCSKEVPRERMDMKEAVAKLQSIKEMVLG